MRTHPLRLYWRQILKQQAVLWHPETDGEAIGTPVPGDLAPELALHAGATQHTAEADLLLGRIHGGPATLRPHDDLLIARSEEHTSELQSLMRISSPTICFNH